MGWLLLLIGILIALGASCFWLGFLFGRECGMQEMIKYFRQREV